MSQCNASRFASRSYILAADSTDAVFVGRLPSSRCADQGHASQHDTLAPLLIIYEPQVDWAVDRLTEVLEEAASSPVQAEHE